MTDSKRFSGRLALVTGASRGIGAATAEALAATGAHVILVARTTSALEQVEERIHEAGGSATIAPLDLTDGENIGKLAGAVGERWQKLDILVLNAAMLGSLTPVQDIDPKEYSRLLSLNLLANQALIAAFDPLLRRADQADVVALTSSVGSEPRAFWGAYGSSKAALEILLGAYADETQHTKRVRVHVVDPGATRTRMRALAFPGEEPESVKPPEIVAEAIIQRLSGEAATGEKVRLDAWLAPSAAEA
jgi:NAD(P)-dependent dehydrogenase (short-subunit alcohol dehydrogenase family)